MKKSELRQLIKEEIRREIKSLSLNENVNNELEMIKKSLNGYWESYYKGVNAGRKDEGYIEINNENDLYNYITGKLGDVVEKITLIEKGKTYPYNRSNPYKHDIYEVSLTNGTTFNITRIYGRPNWSGNVDYKEQLEVS